MLYGENFYPRTESLRDARVFLLLLQEDATHALSQLALQESKPLNTLLRVYARGVRAWSLGHRVDTTPEQWGLARVVEFVNGGASARTVDRDLAEPIRAATPVHVEDAVSPDTVGIMLPIPLAVAEKYKLDIQGAEDPAEFHVTLVYLGKLTPEVLAEVRLAVERVAAQTVPFDGKISGIGRFDAPEKDPLYLSIDAVGLSTFREAIFAALPPSNQNHGFTPHCTIAYLPKDVATPEVTIHDNVLHFDRVEVWVGAKREVFLLKGTKVEGVANFDREAAEIAKTAMQKWLADKAIAHVAVGVGIGSDHRYRVEVRVFSDGVDTRKFPEKMQGVRVNVVRMPSPVAQAADSTNSAVLVGQIEALLREADEACSHAKDFHRLVNMSPAEIRRWAKDPRARCASFPATLRRLPALAALKEKPVSQWTKRDCSFSARVVNFNSRMDGMRKEHGNTDKINVSLRNWGRAVGEPPKECPKDTKHKKW